MYFKFVLTIGIYNLVSLVKEIVYQKVLDLLIGLISNKGSHLTTLFYLEID